VASFRCAKRRDRRNIVQGDIDRGHLMVHRSALVPTVYFSPVTGMGQVRLPATAAPPSVAVPGPTATGGVVAPSGPVGHGTIKLQPRPPLYAASRTPSPPPPVRETAGAGRSGHGAIRLRG
jgi:hypothetical protein